MLFAALVVALQVKQFYTAPTAIRSLMRAGDLYVKQHLRDTLRILGSVGEPINPEAWKWYHDIVSAAGCMFRPFGIPGTPFGIIGQLGGLGCALVCEVIGSRDELVAALGTHWAPTGDVLLLAHVQVPVRCEHEEAYHACQRG